MPLAFETEPTTDQENTEPQAIFDATTGTMTLRGANYTTHWAAPELLKDEPSRLGSDIGAQGWIAYEVRILGSIVIHSRLIKSY